MNLQSEIFILIGPPGSGKGSISGLCIEELGWVQLSTGNLCRKHIVEQTEIGKKIDLIIKSGKLVDDDLVANMVVDWFADQVYNVPAIILDGYPRTLPQARTLNQFFKANFPNLNVQIIKFGISDDAVVDRLCNRLVCQNKNCQVVYSGNPDSSLSSEKQHACDECSGILGKRDDDVEESVRKRLQIYHKHEQDLINFYHQIGFQIKELDADGTLQHVYKNFKQIIYFNA